MMVNHTGFIFIAPNGAYLTCKENADHNIRVKNNMNLTIHLDAATLFPSPNLPHSCNWGKVIEALSEFGLHGLVEKYLIPLNAKSFQRIEIIGVPNES